MKKPWRYWFTGGIAAVLAAASQAQPSQDVRNSRSRWSVEETVERISQQARRHGVPVLARVPTRGASFLLVLGSDEAHTPVLQVSRGAALSLPLTLRVFNVDGGGAEVAFTDALWLAEHDGLPAELLARVASLPELVDAALQARFEAV